MTEYHGWLIVSALFALAMLGILLVSYQLTTIITLLEASCVS